MTPVASDTEGAAGAGVVAFGLESAEVFVVNVADFDIANFAGFGFFGLFRGREWHCLTGALDDDFWAFAEEKLDGEVKTGGVIYEGVNLLFV